MNLTWLSDNLLYYLLILVVLLVWDVVDFYVQLGYTRFLTKIFWLHYSVRAFFSISLMELSIALGLINIENKAIIAFVTPLIFSTMLQNLVVKIGGKENTRLDFSKLFDDFRDKILENLRDQEIMRKNKLRERIVNSKVPTEEIEKACNIYAEDQTQFKRLKVALSQLSDLDKRVEYAQQLLEWGIDYGEELLKKGS